MKASVAANEMANKMSIEQLEVEELKEARNDGDYAGAAAKTDPVEIKLVHKLDYRIMVSTQVPRASRTDLKSPR